MLELSRLIDSLAGSEGQGIDTLDPTFQDIASMVAEADYAKAADQSQETFTEGPDLRLIAWFLYGLFLQDGMPSLAPMLQAWASIFRDSFAAVGPERKKENHASAAMSWFMSKFEKRISDDEVAAELTKQTNFEEATAALDGLDDLALAFAEAVPANPGKVTEPLRQVRGWLSGVVTELTPPEEPEESEAPEESGELATAPGAPGARLDASSVEASFRMVELQERIAAFEQLMSRNEVAKASVIANDVMQVVSAFDPRLYLPRLFAGFFAQFARRTPEIFAFQAKKGSAPWQIYDELYRTDLDGFVRAGEDEFQQMLNDAPALAGASPSAAPPAPAPPAPAPSPPDDGDDGNDGNDGNDGDW